MIDKIYKESELPKGASVYYLCKHAAASRPCYINENMHCIFPRCKYTEEKEHAIECDGQRKFIKNGNDFFEVNMKGW